MLWEGFGKMIYICFGDKAQKWEREKPFDLSHKKSLWVK